MATPDWGALDDILDKADKGSASAAQKGQGGPMPGLIPGGALDIDTIIQKAEAGTLPSAEAAQGAAEPPSQSTASRLSRMFGVDQAVGNLLRYAGPWMGTPEVYNPVDAALHGQTLGASDVARGVVRDVITGQPMGTGIGQTREARQRFEEQYPGVNFAGNAIGGLAMPMPGMKAATEAITGIPSALGRFGASLGLGGAVGAGTGAVTGALDEFPEGRAAMLDAAKHGALWGGAVGTGIPAGVAAVLGAKRGVQNYLGPRDWFSRNPSEGAAGRIIMDRATDPTALADVAGNYGPATPAAPFAPSPATGWRTGLRQPTRAEQLQARIDADAANVNPDAGITPGVPTIPGSMPTTGQISGDQGVLALESAQVARIMRQKPDSTTWTPEERDLAEKVQRQGQARVSAFEGLQDPGADPASVVSPLRTRLDEITAPHETAIGEAKQREADLPAQQQAEIAAQQQRIEQQRAALGATTEAEARGATARDQLEATKKTDKEEASKVWQAVDPDNTLRIDHTPVKAAAKQITAEIPKSAKPPEGEEAAIFGIAKMGGTKVPFQETQALRSRLLTAIREERANNGETPALRRMTLLRESIDDAIPASLDEAANQRFQAATAATRDIAEKYKNQFVGPLLTVRGAAGDFRVPDTNVGQKIILNNESAQAFVAAGGDHATLRGALVDDLQKTFGDKPMTEAALNVWRGKREGALRAVEGFGDDVANVGRAQTTLDNLRQAQAAERTTAAGAVKTAEAAKADAAKEFQQGAIGRLLEPGIDPGKQIAGILNSRDAVPQLMRLQQTIGNDPDARAGLARAVFDHIGNRFINQQTGDFKPAEFQKYLNDKGGAIEAAVGKDGMKILRAISADMLRPQPGAPQMAGANRGGTASSFANVFRAAIQGNTQDGVKLMLPAILGATGGAVPSFVATALTAGLNRMRAHGINNINDVLVRAAGDPAYMRAIMMKATPANVPLFQRALDAALVSGRAGPALSPDYGAVERRARRRGQELLMAPSP